MFTTKHKETLELPSGAICNLDFNCYMNHKKTHVQDAISARGRLLQATLLKHTL